MTISKAVRALCDEIEDRVGEGWAHDPDCLTCESIHRAFYANGLRVAERVRQACAVACRGAVAAEAIRDLDLTPYLTEP